MKVHARAPGKVIWFGEHFVVKGKPAIASAIDLYADVTIEPIDSDRVIIESRDKGVVYDYSRRGKPPRLLKPFKHVIDYIVGEGYTGRPRGIYARISSSIPVGAGLGSSAATLVAFTAAFLKYHGVPMDSNTVSKIAYEGEKIVHGKPSGIDNTVSTHGGFILYKQGVLQKIDYVWRDDYVLLVVDTGISRNTGHAVKRVLDRYNRVPNVMTKIYDAAEEIVYTALKYLRKGDFEQLGELMNIAHGLLASIGVSIKRIESIIHTALKQGASGAKLTGAGLGGCVLVLVRNDLLDRVSHSISRVSKKIRIFPVKPIGKGYSVRVYE